MNKYDVSIILGVYNVEEYISEAIESLINQEYDFSKIEVILVNDGSPDNSEEIIKNYTKKFDNIKLVNKENGGISSARNAGIKVSQGKYIMILDPDDYLSKETVKNLVTFMDNHPETDISTYTMINLFPDGRETQHFRNKFFPDGTKVYDVNDFPYISQACVNIIYRNKYQDNILYKEGMTYGEDENYNTKVIMEKGKIGFVSDATYYYRRHGDGQASEVLKNPLYCFESILNNYEYFFNKYKNVDGSIPKYIQGIFINCIRWRINEDELLPYYQDSIEFDKSMERLYKLIRQLDIEMISNNPSMDKYHKFYIYKIMGIEPEVKLENEHFVISHKGKILEEAKRVALRINRFKVDKNKLSIVGYIRSIILLYKPFKLYSITIDNDGKETKTELSLKDSVYSAYKSNMRTTDIYAFDLTLDISNIKDLYFIVEIEGKTLYCNYEYSQYVPFFKKFHIKSYSTDDKVITKNYRGFEFKKKNILNNIYYNAIRKAMIICKYPYALGYRRASKKLKKERIWLYCDRKGIIDNAYYQFKHDIEKKDGIKRYYIIDDEPNKMKKYFTPKEMKENIIIKNTKEDIIYHLAAEYIITSFGSLYEYSPYYLRDYKLYNDITQYKLIYLQHGILYANLPKMYSKESTEIDKIVISSEFEKNNFINNYNYNSEDLIMTGMPRFGLKNEKITKKKKILYAPSWRSYLIQDRPVNGVRPLTEKAFLNSKYYNEINSLFHNEKLSQELKKNNIQLEIKMHPIFKEYAKFFKENLSNIKIVDEINNEKEYSLFITDFSSYQFDFARLKTPIIYFVPDETEFKAGLHSYRKLDLPLEEAFGDVVKNAQELEKEILYYVKNDFKIKKEYETRCKKFFVKESNPQEKIYQELLNR